MADAVTLTNTGDAWISNRSDLRDENFSGTQKLYVKENKPDKRWAYLYFGQPFPKGLTGVQVTKAYVELVNGTAIEGGTLSVQRISGPWKRKRITWNDQPSVSGSIETLTKTGTVPAGTKWRVPIQPIMQSVANGSPWYGLRFTMDDGKGEWFHGSESKRAGERPLIYIEYVDPMETPTNLSPGNDNFITDSKPFLDWDWTDDRGATAINAVRVEISNDNFATIAWDSEWQPSTVAEYHLAGSSYAGVAEGSRVYWRCYVRDANGVESPVSPVAKFQRKTMIFPVITNPSGAEPNAIVQENSPPIIWTYAGNQVHWQVVIYDHLDSNKILADSKKSPGSAVRGWTPPANTKLLTDREYTVEIRIWDDVPRQANDLQPAYAARRKIFKVVFSATVAPVTNLNVTQVTPYHWSKIEWQRATAADRYEIYANGILMAKIESVDVDVTGGIYSYIIRTAPPRRDVVWSVVAIQNGVGSLNSPTVTKNFKARSAVLSETDGSSPIMFLNYEKDQGSSRQQTVHDVVGEHPPVLIKQALGGRNGSFTGILSGNSVPGVSAEEEKTRWELLDKNEGRRLLITILNESFVCYIAEGEIQSFADAEGIFYEVSFDYYEMDFR